MAIHMAALIPSWMGQRVPIVRVFGVRSSSSRASGHECTCMRLWLCPSLLCAIVAVLIAGSCEIVCKTRKRATSCMYIGCRSFLAISLCARVALRSYFASGWDYGCCWQSMELVSGKPADRYARPLPVFGPAKSRHRIMSSMCVGKLFTEASGIIRVVGCHSRLTGICFSDVDSCLFNLHGE